MKHKNLHEIAKFASGLVAADLATTIWLAYSGMLPITFLGIAFTDAMVWPAIVLDIALLGILIHYGWHIGKIPALRERTYLLIAGTVFTIVAAAHLARVFFGVDITIVNWVVPHWISWTAAIVVTYLSYMSFRLAMRIKN